LGETRHDFGIIPCSEKVEPGVFFSHNGGQIIARKYHLFYQSLLFTNECTSDCLKNNIKIYITIALTCFSAVTPSSLSSLSALANLTLC